MIRIFVSLWFDYMLLPSKKSSLEMKSSYSSHVFSLAKSESGTNMNGYKVVEW